MSFGATLSLTIVGAGMRAVGGTTIVGAEIGHFMVWKKRMKKVEELSQKDKKAFQEVLELSRNWKMMR